MLIVLTTNIVLDIVFYVEFEQVLQTEGNKVAPDSAREPYRKKAGGVVLICRPGHPKRCLCFNGTSAIGGWRRNG